MRLRKDVRDWVTKAEEDYAVVQALRRRRKPSFNNALCFHAQQCAEKYLKALLVQSRVTFPKTHDVLELLERARAIAPHLVLLKPFLEYLELFAVNFRYPGEFATRAEAQRAVRRLLHVRSAIRLELGLSS